MSAIERILSRLPAVKETNGGWSAHCPAHEDSKPSLSISEGRDGRVLIKCHAGCDHKKIVAALGLEQRDLFEDDGTRPSTTKNSSLSKPNRKAYATADAAQKAYERTRKRPADHVWPYKLNGEIVGFTLRWDKPDGTKDDVRPINRHADGWRLEQMAEPRPLFKIDKIRDFLSDDSDGLPVFVVEGEKCVDAAEKLELLATTSAGGCNAASQTDWTPLAGRKVVILPDNDDAGRKYADDVAAILHELDPPATVRVVELDGLEPGGDVADLHEACRSDDELKALREKIERLADETEPLPRPASMTAATASLDASTKIEPWRLFPTWALPRVAAKLVEESAHSIGCDEAFVALPMLAVLGSAIGTTRRVELKPDWFALPIIWTVTVAESGSQKSPAADVSLDHVREREDRLHESNSATFSTYELELEDYEKCRSAWRTNKKSAEPPPKRPLPPPRRRVLVEDVTVEALGSALADNPRGLIVANDEFSGWLGGMGRYNGAPSADEAFFLKAYSGRSHDVCRRTGPTIHIRQAAVWITGTIQPGVLQRALGVERRESGFLARLLLAHPPRRQKKWTADSIGRATKENFVRVLDKLYSLRPDLVDGREESRTVRLSSEARKLFIDFYEQHDGEARQYSGDLAAAWSKLEEHPGRLALIIHETRLAAGETVVTDEIDVASMAAAIELVGWFKHETRRVYSLLAESKIERTAREEDDRLADLVRDRGGSVSLSDLVTFGRRWIPNTTHAARLVKRLVDAGRGHWSKRPSTSKGGRPTRIFVLDSEAASAQPPAPPSETSSADADADRLPNPGVEGGYIDI